MAQNYRATFLAGQLAECEQIEKKYLLELEAHFKSNGLYPLGEDSELPDEKMPAAYVKNRQEVLNSLEDRLSQLAIDYRSGLTSEAQEKAISDYGLAMDEMYRIGHWIAPDPDSSLPDELMPQSYHARRKIRIQNFRKK